MKKFFVKALAVLLVCLFVVSGINFSIFASDATNDTKSTSTSLGDKLVAMNVALTGRVKMYFYFTNVEGTVDYYEINVAGETRRVYVEDMGTSVKNGKTRRVLEVSVAPAQQTVGVVITSYKNGVAGKPRTYSVKDYVTAAIKQGASEKTIAAMESMLNYGAMAQVAFNCNEKDLANKDLYFGSTNPINNMSIDDLFGIKDSVKGATNEEKLCFSKMGAYLNDTVALRCYLSYDGDYTKLKVTIDGIYCGNDVVKDGNEYYILIDNIAATRFDHQYNITVTDGTNSASVKYSVLNYISDCVQDTTKSAAQKNTAYSMFVYYTKMSEYAYPDQELVGKPTTCNHDRSYVEAKNYRELCSDCGEDITPTDLLQNANNLANGVTSYFGTADGNVDGLRQNYVVENGNMKLYYPLATTNTVPTNSGGTPESKFLATITNKEGTPYVEDTMDVYVTTSDGTYYASNSRKSATANIYRYGYYYYDIHTYGQNFINTYNIRPGSAIDLTRFVNGYQNQMTIADGATSTALTCTIDGTSDPYIQMNDNVSIASTYNAIQITMTVTSTTQVQLRYTTSSSEDFGETHRVDFDTIADGKEHTYTVFFEESVTKYRFRLDFNGKMDEKIEIKNFKPARANIGSAPELLLDRGLHTYTDKMHQVLSIVAPKGEVEVTEVGMTTDVTASAIVIVDKDGNETTSLASDGSVSNVAYAGFQTTAGVFGYILPYGDESSTITVSYDGTKYTITQTMGATTIKQQHTLKADSEKEPIYKYDSSGEIVTDSEGNKIILGYKSVLQTFIDKADSITKYGQVALDAIGKSTNIYNSPTQFYFGQRIYTDTETTFDKFLKEAEIERNPLDDENIKINTEKTPDATFDGYDGYRGMYAFTIPENIGFNAGYYYANNLHGEVSFSITGDEYDRNMYVMAYSYGCSVEGGAVLDKDDTLLPIPTEVSKNFDHEFEAPLWLWGDVGYSEVRIPVYVKAGETEELTVLQTYMNWGQYPLKQISSIQFFAPYYHLSTGVTESNCIANYYVHGKDLQTLPDHRAASAPFWSEEKGDTTGDGIPDDDPQHDNGGFHLWLQYTDSSNNKVASEPVRSKINSAGLTYADIDMTYRSDDNKIEVTYKHLEMPQTDENRAYYEIRYEILGDVTISDFANNFSFYSVYGYGNGYQKFSYWDGAKSVPVSLETTDNDKPYTLGATSTHPYFTLYSIDNVKYVAQEGGDYTKNDDGTYTKVESGKGDFVKEQNIQNANVSFLILDHKASVASGAITDSTNFVVNVANRTASLSFDVNDTVTLTEGDTITIYAIVMPWGDHDSTDDTLVQNVRKNTLVSPIVASPVGENTSAVENVFVPTVKTTNGLEAIVTIGHANKDKVALTESTKINVAFRVDGFKVLTIPKLLESTDNGENWTPVELSSINTPDKSGNAHEYDGYFVHYNADGTYSYSFVTTITGETDRLFKVVVDETNVDWEENHGDLYYDATSIYGVASYGSGFYTPDPENANDTEVGVKLDDSGDFVTLKNGNSADVNTRTFKIVGGSAAKYMVIKYRIPEDNVANRLQFYINTNGADLADATAKFDLYSGSVIKQTGDWQVAVVDLASIVAEKNLTDMVMSSAGTFDIKVFRFDPFTVASGDSFDVAYIGFCRDLQTAVDWNSDMDVSNISYVTGEQKSSSISNILDQMKYKDMNVVFTGQSLANVMKDGTYDKDIASATVNDAGNAVVTSNSSGDSYFGFTVSGKATGKYLVMKYKTVNVATATNSFYAMACAEGKYTSYDANGNAALSKAYGVYADGKWHTVVIDLTLLGDGIATSADGKHYVTAFRTDILDSLPVGSSIEFEYIGLCDEISDIPLDGGVVPEFANKWTGYVINCVTMDGNPATSNNPSIDSGATQTSSLNGFVWASSGSWIVLDNQTLKDISICITDKCGMEHLTSLPNTATQTSNSWWEGTDITPYAKKTVANSGLGYGDSTIGYRFATSADLSEYAGETVNLSLRATTSDGSVLTFYSVDITVPSKAQMDVVYKGGDLVDILRERNSYNNHLKSVKLNLDGTVTVVSDLSGDSYFGFELDGSTLTGQYLVIKYRTSASPISSGRVYYSASTEGKSGQLITTYGVTPDGRWHTLVIDLSENSGVAAEADGTYCIKNVRVDLFDVLPAGSAVDFEYVGLCDTLDDIQLAENEHIEMSSQKWKANIGALTVDGVAPATKDDCTYDAGASPRDGCEYLLEGSVLNMADCWIAIVGKSVQDISYCIVGEDGVENWTGLTDAEGQSNSWWIGEDGVQTAAKNYGEIYGDKENTKGYRFLVNKDLSAYVGQTVHFSIRAVTDDNRAVTVFAIDIKVPYTADANYFDSMELATGISEAYYDGDTSSGYLKVTNSAVSDGNGTITFNKEKLMMNGTPKYAVIRYKNTAASKLCIYATTSGKNHKENWVTLKTDGAWHVVVVDLEAVGSYTAGDAISLFRFDILEGADDVTKSIIFDYVWLTDDINYVEYEEYDKLDISYTGEALKGIFVDANGKYDPGLTGATVNTDGTVTVSYGSDVDRYFNVYPNGSLVSGQYLVMKYRTGEGVTLAGTSCYALAYDAKNNYTEHVPITAGAAADGEWHVLVIDLSKLGNGIQLGDDGEYHVTSFRADIFEAFSTNGTVDFAYIGFCDDLGDIILDGGVIEFGNKRYSNNVDFIYADGNTANNLKESVAATGSVDATILKYIGWLGVAGCEANGISYVVTDESGNRTTIDLVHSTSGTNIYHKGSEAIQNEVKGLGDGTVGYSINFTADLSAWEGQTVTVSIIEYITDITVVQTYSITVNVPDAE